MLLAHGESWLRAGEGEITGGGFSYGGVLIVDSGFVKVLRTYVHYVCTFVCISTYV